MSGNVWEWYSDFYGGYSSSAQTNPYDSTVIYGRVIRGGSWSNIATGTRVADRSFFGPDSSSNYLGFRIARSVPYEGENRPPLAPYNPSPSNGAVAGDTSVTLIWDSYDPDQDIMTYDVYFGTNTNLTTRVVAKQAETSFRIEGLSYDTTYYWKVVPKDNRGAKMEGPVWEFNIQEPPKQAMVLVKKGSFTMGDIWWNGYSDENPTHQVMLTYDFHIGKYETSFDEYDIFCNTTGKSKPEGWERGNRPVINVTWWDAIAYCNWLSEIEGFPKAYDSNGNLLDKYGNITTDPSKVFGYRLPTEAEWEYVARGGNNSKGYKYSGSDNVDDVAWYRSNSDFKTQEVRKKAPNELGVYDMSGNAEEWCSDWYGPYSGSAQTNPYNYTLGSRREIRGGSWYGNASLARVVYRFSTNPDNSINDRGFRIARSVP